MMIRRLICGSLTALLVTTVALAQQHPNQERGFAPDKVFSLYGIDNVNVFNGNLTVTIPIGPTYRSNGDLSYGFNLVYSGNVWDYSLSSGSPLVTTVIPNRRSNAGVGWLLSLGRLVPPTDPTNETYTNPPPAWTPCDQAWQVWVYESSDGNDHVLYPTLHGSGACDNLHWYTRDGTYIRMTVVDSATRYIEFSDGTYQMFQELVPATGLWAVATTPGAGVWKLTAISDRFGNSATIDYRTDSTYPERWTVHDGSREHNVYFVAASSPYSIMLDHVDLAAPGGGVATYSFTQTYKAVERGWGDTSGSGGFPGPAWWIPLLTSVTFPAVSGSSATYRMELSGVPDYDVTGQTTGHLRGLQLPTGGWIEWDYSVFLFPTDSGSIRRTRAIGITARRLLDASRNVVGTWGYSRQLSNRPTCPTQFGGGFGPSEQLVAAITPPVGALEVYYFSVYATPTEGDPCPTGLGWDVSEYGLPISRGVSDPNGSRFLSKEWRTGSISIGTGPTLGYRATGGTLLRSSFSKFQLEVGSGFTSRSAYDTNKRVTSESTRYDDDSGCSGTCFVATNYFGFDGFGHFRQASIDGNFVDGALTSIPDAAHRFRTHFTNFHSTLDNNQWVLGTSSETCVADESSARTTEIATCSALSDPAIVKTLFERSTGFLLKRRTLSGAALGGTDLLSVFAHTTAGNLSTESYYGGDAYRDGSAITQLNTTTDFPTSLPPATYSITHSYTTNGSGTLTHHDASYAGVSLLTADEDYDPSTGLVSASRDTAGVQTVYFYDSRGRVSSIRPTGESWTGISYTDAANSGGSPINATAQVTRYHNGSIGGEILSRMSYEYDPFGRLIAERRLMPDGTTSTKTSSYNVLNWPVFVSCLESNDPAQHGTSYTYDPFGRAATVTTADSKTTTYSYAGVRQVERTASVGSTPVNSTVREIYDSSRRLRQVLEPNLTAGSLSFPNSRTTYLYDRGDRLAQAKMEADPLSNPAGPQQFRTFSYDNRGLLMQDDTPEGGSTAYTYDARGHMLTKSLGGANTLYDLRLAYDAVERLADVKAVNPDYQAGNPDPARHDVFRVIKHFDYGSGNGTNNLVKGKLLAATRYNYPIDTDASNYETNTVRVTETYTYGDTAGRRTARNTTIDAYKPSTQQWATIKSIDQSAFYDDLGSPTDLGYPMCTGCGLPTQQLQHFYPTYSYGAIKTVPGYVNDVSYLSNGMVGRVLHGNNIPDVQSIDSNTLLQRPNSIKFGTVNVSTEEYSDCTAPTVQQPVSTPATITSGNSATLSVSASGSQPLSYQWYTYDPNTTNVDTVSGATSGSVTVSPTQTMEYFVEVWNDCKHVNSNHVTVTVNNQCQTPKITLITQDQTVPAATTLTLAASGTGSGDLTYKWYVRQNGNAVQIGTGASISSGPITATTVYYVVLSTSCDSATAQSFDLVVTVPLSAPSGLVATFSAANTITVSWQPSPGAASYRLERRSNGLPYVAISHGTPITASPYVDDGRAPDTTYQYRIIALDANGASDSPPSNSDIATTWTFATVAPGMAFSAGYFDELLVHGVNDVRVAAGYAPVTWQQILPATVPPPALGGLVYGAYIDTTRREMNRALQALGMPTPTYTDTPIGNALVRANYLTEVQRAAQ
jgi:YD repeat-containing protein